jgi:hypothetical protein
MSDNFKTIPVQFADTSIKLSIYGEGSDTTIFEVEDAVENGEAQFQIQEGCFYEYKISDNFRLKTSEIVSQSKINPCTGRISPNIYVGTLSLDILNARGEKCSEIKLEVQSKKTTYRKDYRQMLEDITDKCTELLLQINSPVSQLVEVDFNADAKTLYQRFAFIKSIIDSVEFNDAVNKIISSPVTKWKECEIQRDIRAVKRIDSSALRQIASSINRVILLDNHPLKSVLKSVPSKINVSSKTETVDTPENRFIKYALNTFRSFIGDFRIKLKGETRIRNEAALMETRLEEYLSHSVFKEISNPATLPLNSPVLQRKEGYREILRVWLMFDLAARLVWHGGDDIYSGDKKDVAVLYEYWLFFKLLDVFKELFDIEPKAIEELIKETDDGLGLQLRQGKHIPLKGIYNKGNRKLHIEFSYNRAFGGKKTYPDSGSWTKNMRPDYTLTIWPYGISQQQAEKEEIIVHIHFDAKYKIENLSSIFGDLNKNELSEEDIQTELTSEKNEQIKGTFKRIDLLKMHAYKDAIRRTGGAYVLYPGSEEYIGKGFHEIIPGLGAFPISPSKSNDGTKELKKFLNEIVEHFLNRASQREKISLKAYETYNTKEINKVNELIPEYSDGKKLIPDETYVLVGFYNSPEKYKWITRNKLYNFRIGSGKGSLILDKETVSSKYLLLHTTGEKNSGDLWKIVSKGLRVFSKNELIEKGYPSPSQDNYIVIQIEKLSDPEFENVSWDFRNLKNYSTKNASAFPFTTSLSELMNVVKK